jgi:tRNA nucleotidyltransferase/poly(A) polymerase
MATSPLSQWLPEWVIDNLLPVRQGATIWLVGGALRDKFLNRNTLDFDFAVEGEARQVARSFADAINAHYFDLDPDRDTGRVIYIASEEVRYILDFARLRGNTITEDLGRRDFTINSLAVDLATPQELIDPTKGMSDLKNRILRATSERSFIDDPIRVLRAVRFVLLIEGRIESGTLDLIRQSIAKSAQISSERVRDELFRIFVHPRPIRSLRLMDHLGIIGHVFPDLENLKRVPIPPPGEGNLWDQTLSVVDHLGSLLAVMAAEHDPESASQLTLGEFVYRIGRFRNELNEYLDSQLSFGRSIRQLLVLAALYHNVGKTVSTAGAEAEFRSELHEQRGAALVKDMSKTLRLSNPEVTWLSKVVRGHSRPLQLSMTGNVTKREIYRFLRDSEEAAPGILLLSTAIALAVGVEQDFWGEQIQAVRRILNEYFAQGGKSSRRKALVKGDEIAQELGISPGPEIGHILSVIAEAQAVGEVVTRAEAIELARMTLDELGSNG